MINHKIIKIFDLIGDYYLIKNSPFKPAAYHRAARLIESLTVDLADVYQQGGIKALASLPGIGQSMAQKIEEFIKKGFVQELVDFQKDMPVDLAGLTAIEGVGPKMVKILYQQLGIKTVDDLKKAALAKKIRQLPGFGEKSEENILRGIKFLQQGQGRFILGFILPFVRQIAQRLRDLPEVERLEIAGSVRRRRETIGDIDLLAISDQPLKVMDYFCSMPEVEEVYGRGQTKSSVRLDIGIDVDLRVIKKKSFGAAWQYFTGSKDHNIKLRKLAIEKGLKINEYGVFQRGKNGQEDKWVAGKQEKEIYQAVGLPWIPPEIRLNRGEIEAAMVEQLPQIVEYDEVLGDLHSHTDWSDGSETIEEMAWAAIKLGRQYLAITDHSSGLSIAHGLDKKRILKQIKEIDKVNQKIKQKGYNFRLLKGVELNILPDGRVDLPDDVLAKLDVVLAAIHHHFKMPKEEMTERICRAMENPNIDIIAHPTGRLIQEREGYQLDFEKIFKKARETGTILEINATPNRLDLKDEHIRQAVKFGVK
ncbi:MAG TPA: DNA polymerase/3'-5' exonuclease PolX, partial [Candidatus Portnoybacteria bacterium]|nr:DNA polymerase/3'-5' exonuclease PolX [Candidatus Portnoybacteria bacterium]